MVAGKLVWLNNGKLLPIKAVHLNGIFDIQPTPKTYAITPCPVADPI